MEKLDVLPHIARLSKNVVRILGQNPGKFTLQGTNTYLVGQRNPFILIDTGEGKEEYIPYLEEALKGVEAPTDPDQPDISDIILTHKHHDHVSGLPHVLTLLSRLWSARHSTASRPFIPPRIHKIPLSVPDSYLQSVLETVPSHPHTPSPSGQPIHDLHDGQTIPVTGSPPGSALHVIHTPGHTPDSLCLYFPDDHALFTADSVLGHGSAVFENLGDYMGSLRKMIDYNNREREQQRYTTVYPGHGPVIADGPKHIAMYLHHRVEREEQIVKVLGQPPAKEDEPWTTWTIVSVIYKNYPPPLWEPAAHSVDLHLRKLESEGRVELLGGQGKDTRWVFIR